MTRVDRGLHWASCRSHASASAKNVKYWNSENTYVYGVWFTKHSLSARLGSVTNPAIQALLGPLFQWNVWICTPQLGRIRDRSVSSLLETTAPFIRLLLALSDGKR